MQIQEAPTAATFTARSAPEPRRDQRGDQRFRVNQPVYLSAIGESNTRLCGVLANISRKGARVRASAGSIHVGAAVRIDLADRVLLGIVRNRVDDGTNVNLGIELFSSWKSITEEILARQEAQLARQHEELRKLAYSAAQDIHQPLSAMILHLELFMKTNKTPLSTDASYYINRAIEGAQQTRDLLRELLAYCLMDLGNNDYVIVDTEEVLTELRSSLLEKMPAASITNDPLPSVVARPEQIRTIFGHLLSNALTFNRDEHPSIHVCATETREYTIFTFRDNGIGIAPEHHDRIFGVFERVDVSGVFPGNGMGLATVKRVVESLGGYVSVASDPGLGSTFLIALPKPLSGQEESSADDERCRSRSRRKTTAEEYLL